MWTVNDPDVMKWVIGNDEISGVCTDDPEAFVRLVEARERGEWSVEENERGGWNLRRLWKFWKTWATVGIVGMIVRVLWRERFKEKYEGGEEGRKTGIAKKVEEVEDEEIERVLGEVGEV